MDKLSQQELWEKIQNFSLDDPYSSYPFSKKLASGNNWSTSFTSKAIEEYKKFIYLCCISPTGASPSEPVDKVWHLHLTYTDNYWNKFCNQTLKKEIHHHPSKGGSDEKLKHQNWYSDTLVLYEKEFGYQPPVDAWPGQQPYNNEINETVYDNRFFARIVLGFLITTTLYILGMDLFRTTGKEFLVYYCILCLLGLTFLAVTQVHKDNRLNTIVLNNLPGILNPYQIARFLYGSHRSYQTAIIDLLRRDIIEMDGNDYRLRTNSNCDLSSEKNPLLQPLLENIQQGETFTYMQGLGYIDRETVLNPAIEKLHRFSQKIDYEKFIIPGIVLLIGSLRFVQGLVNVKPVGYLVILMVAFSVICLMLLQYYSYTVAVKRHFGNFWKEHNNDGYGNDAINNFTILGSPLAAGIVEYAVLTAVFDAVTPQQKRTDSSGSDGCSSTNSCGSDGGSSCGGGCGGCGGGD